MSSITEQNINELVECRKQFSYDNMIKTNAQLQESSSLFSKRNKLVIPNKTYTTRDLLQAARKQEPIWTVVVINEEVNKLFNLPPKESNQVDFLSQKFSSCDNIDGNSKEVFSLLLRVPSLVWYKVDNLLVCTPLCHTQATEVINQITPRSQKFYLTPWKSGKCFSLSLLALEELIEWKTGTKLNQITNNLSEFTNVGSFRFYSKILFRSEMEKVIESYEKAIKEIWTTEDVINLVNKNKLLLETKVPFLDNYEVLDNSPIIVASSQVFDKSPILQNSGLVSPFLKIENGLLNGKTVPTIEQLGCYINSKITKRENKSGSIMCAFITQEDKQQSKKNEGTLFGCITLVLDYGKVVFYKVFINGSKIKIYDQENRQVVFFTHPVINVSSLELFFVRECLSKRGIPFVMEKLDQKEAKSFLISNGIRDLVLEENLNILCVRSLEKNKPIDVWPSYLSNKIIRPILLKSGGSAFNQSLVTEMPSCSSCTEEISSLIRKNDYDAIENFLNEYLLLEELVIYTDSSKVKELLERGEVDSNLINDPIAVINKTFAFISGKLTTELLLSLERLTHVYETSELLVFDNIPDESSNLAYFVFQNRKNSLLPELTSLSQSFANSIKKYFKKSFQVHYHYGDYGSSISRNINKKAFIEFVNLKQSDETLDPYSLLSLAYKSRTSLNLVLNEINPRYSSSTFSENMMLLILEQQIQITNALSNLVKVNFPKYERIRKEIKSLEGSLSNVLFSIGIKSGPYKVSSGWIKLFEVLVVTNLFNSNAPINALFVMNHPDNLINSIGTYLEFYLKRVEYLWLGITSKDKLLILNDKENWEHGIDEKENIDFKLVRKPNFLFIDCSISSMLTNRCKFILEHLELGGDCIIKVPLTLFDNYPVLSTFYLMYSSFEKMVIYRSTYEFFSTESYVVFINYKSKATKEERIRLKLDPGKWNDFCSKVCEASGLVCFSINDQLEKIKLFIDFYEKVGNSIKKPMLRVINTCNGAWASKFMQKKYVLWLSEFRKE